MRRILPEGRIFKTIENQNIISSEKNLREAFEKEIFIEGIATRCDKEHNLHINLGSIDGIIPREEGALGITEGTVRDIAIISRVNKPVLCKITSFEINDGKTVAILSRKAVQEEHKSNFISKLTPGDIIDATVTHFESFGVFADIGAGISALLPIDSISVSRIPHPCARFKINQHIKAIVKSVDEAGRITLTHKELLGTWDENAANFNIGETVPGIIRSVESFGIFVELAPNLAGLAEITSDADVGNTASVYIKNIMPDKMKIKLIIVDSQPPQPVKNTELKYYIDFNSCNHIDNWLYSPDCCDKIIESSFF